MTDVASLRRVETGDPIRTAKIEIVAPGRPCEVVSTPEAYGSCRSRGKRLETPRLTVSSSPRFPPLLGRRAAPTHRLHRPDDYRSLSRRK